MASLPVLTVPLSAKSGRVKTARRLARRNSRAEHRLFLAEGAKALTEALHSGGVVEVFATEAASEQYAALRKAVDDAGVPWLLVDDDAVASLSGAVTPQGIVAVCRFLDVALDEVLAPVVEERASASVSKPPALVICADVRDPGNAGTVIRTADASGADGVVLAGNSVDPYNDKTVRATVGSLWHLPLALHDDPAEVRPPRAGRRVRRTRCGRGRGDRPVRGRGLGPARRPDRVAVRQRGLGAARRARGAGRPPGLDPDLRPRREPQPVDRRRGLPLRQRPRRPH